MWQHRGCTEPSATAILDESLELIPAEVVVRAKGGDRVMWIWLVIAMLAAIGELLSYDLFLASVAVAAAITAGVALALPFIIIQISLFAVLSLIGIALVRPFLKHALGLESRAGDSLAVSQAHLLGRRAIVTQTVAAGTGQIRIGQGEFWTARAFDPTETLATGDEVEVLLVDGLTALVERTSSPSLPQIDVAAEGALSEKGV